VALALPEDEQGRPAAAPPLQGVHLLAVGLVLRGARVRPGEPLALLPGLQLGPRLRLALGLLLQPLQLALVLLVGALLGGGDRVGGDGVQVGRGRQLGEHVVGRQVGGGHLRGLGVVLHEVADVDQDDRGADRADGDGRDGDVAGQRPPQPPLGLRAVGRDVEPVRVREAGSAGVGRLPGAGDVRAPPAGAVTSARAVTLWHRRSLPYRPGFMSSREMYAHRTARGSPVAVYRSRSSGSRSSSSRSATALSRSTSPAASRAGCRASKISRCIPSKTASSPPGDSRARLTSLTRSTPAGVIWTRVARRSRGCRARVTSPAVSSWSAVSFTVVGCIIRNRPRVLSRARPLPSSARVVSRK